MSRPKTKTHRIRPSLDMTTVAEIAKLFTEQQAEKERRRFEVFQRAWACLPGSSDEFELRVALAAAYLGGGSK
jgi:hypothetical protein